MHPAVARVSIVTFVASSAFVLALAFSATGAIGCNSAPPLDVAPHLELSRFAGKWYEIASLPRLTQADCYGTTAFYTQTAADSFQFVNECNVAGTTGPVKTVTMTATVPDKSDPAKLALQVGGFSGDYWIVEVGADYEYAVVGHPSRDYLWILSRTPTLDASTQAGILQRAHDNQFDTAKLQYTPQPPAGERVTSPTPVGDVPPPLKTGCSASGATRSAPSRGWISLGAGLLAMALVRRRSSAREARIRSQKITARRRCRPL